MVYSAGQWAAAFLALGFLIVVHEGGHYFVARWCQMRIERFSIGFGPGILKRRSKKTGTTFQLAPIPFGGFVEIRGMNIAEDVDPDDKHAYPNRPAWQRFVTIFAGPATNYLSAVVLAFILYSVHGLDRPHWYAVGGTTDGFDAALKLREGDRILEVDHKPIFIDDAPPGDTLQKRINVDHADHATPVVLTIERGGARMEVPVLAKLDPEIKGADGKPIWRLGIKTDAETVAVSIGIFDAAQRAVSFPVDQTKIILSNLYGIITGEEKADPGGPKRIVEEFHKAFQRGWVPGFQLVMMLSVYLGLFNLLPLPALDGGRLVFLGYELITRRRANPKIEAMVHMGGIMVLGVVMILVSLHDCHVF